MGNKNAVHQQDYIPATRNEDKNAEHKRAKREFALAASKYRSSLDVEETTEDLAYFEGGFWDE